MNENTTTPEKGIKGADYLRAELETLPYGKKPVNQWTDEEKARFLKWCTRFNNLISITAPFAIKEEGPYQEGSESYNKLYRDLRQAIIDSGENIDDIRLRLDRNEELWNIFTTDPKKFLNDESMKSERTERVENLVQIYVSLLPSILNLIDGGYTEREIKR